MTRRWLSICLVWLSAIGLSTVALTQARTAAVVTDSPVTEIAILEADEWPAGVDDTRPLLTVFSTTRLTVSIAACCLRAEPAVLPSRTAVRTHDALSVRAPPSASRLRPV